PVIIVTPLVVRSMDELYDEGAEIVFQKPYDRRAIIDAIRQVLDRSARDLNGSPRVEADYQIKLVESAGDHNTFNIGRGGMFIQCAPPMPPIGAPLQFELQLDSGHQIKGSAIVRWQRRYDDGNLPRGVGVEFDYLS